MSAGEKRANGKWGKSGCGARLTRCMYGCNWPFGSVEGVSGTASGMTPPPGEARAPAPSAALFEGVAESAGVSSISRGKAAELWSICSASAVNICTRCPSGSV